MMKAMILAAGLGTRLLPHTSRCPKALVPLAGQPMIAHVLKRFRRYGISNVVVNLHHFGGQIQSYLAKPAFSGFHFFYSDESDLLLDTGGAIKNAAQFFTEGKPFLVHNCDVISQIPLDRMLMHHHESKAIATLAVSKRSTSRPLAFGRDGFLRGRYGQTTEHDSIPLAFSGVSILDPVIFTFMPRAKVFSIIDVLIAACTRFPVVAFEHEPDIWVDAGNIKNFQKAEELLKNVHL